MIIGRLLCEKCGKDCTNLYGFALMTRGTIRNQQTQRELEEIKKEFGKSEFVWCWSCTAKAFGIKTIAEKEQQKPDLPSPKNNNTPNVPEVFKEKLDKGRK